MKKLLVVLPIILIIGIILFFVMKSKPQMSNEIADETPTPAEALPTISDNIKVELTGKQDNKVMVLSVQGLTQDIESIDYELTYNTGAGLPRGVLGKIVTDGEKSITRDDIVLGTCSSGKCVYDVGVTSVDLSLKFNSSKGPSVFRKTYPL
jgi:hypothetical protein